MMQTLLKPQTLAELERQAAACAHPQELVIDVLRAIQLEHGWVPDEGVELTATLLRLTPIQVEEVATFYDKIYRRPVGKKVIHLCDSICCWSRDEQAIREHLQKRLGITMGQTTTDGIFTLLPTVCLGACDKAPAMLVGFNLYGPLTPESVDDILERERQEVST
jgi:NADH-quinone oxidoreductase subunit E